jgi:hypothetical protein
MCKNRHHRRDKFSKKNDPKEIRSSFYSHLVTYIMVNAFVIFNSDHGTNWQWMTIFWGIGLLSHYKKAKWALGNSEMACVRTKDRYQDEIVDDIVPPPPSPEWKDRDLV